MSPGFFSCDWQKASGKRLVPFHREARDVAEDADELVFGDVAGERDRVESGAADGGVGEQGIHREAAFASSAAR